MSLKILHICFRSPLSADSSGMSIVGCEVRDVVDLRSGSAWEDAFRDDGAAVDVLVERLVPATLPGILSNNRRFPQWLWLSYKYYRQICLSMRMFVTLEGTR